MQNLGHGACRCNEAGPANNANEDMEPRRCKRGRSCGQQCNEDMEPDDANEAGPAVNNGDE
jgi:hypothetical protein